MATKAAVQETDIDKAVKSLGPLADALKTTGGKLWKVIWLRYVGKGIAELIVAGALLLVTSPKLYTHHFEWWLIPFGIALLLVLDAVQLLIDPYYPALKDAQAQVKTLTNGKF